MREFDSARSSYEHASRQEASYRAGGSKENAEEARYRRETAFSGMLGAIAHQNKRKSSDFDSAKSSYDHASRQAASYRKQGPTQSINALEAEHRMRTAYGNMLKNSSDLSDSQSRAYASAQNSYEHASRQAASYRQQGSLINAENAEHRMRQAEAAMLKVKAEAKGNSRAFEDARKDYEDASRRYASYKSQGLEADAQRCRDYMDRAHAKMMQNI